MNRDNQDNRNERRRERDQRPGREPSQPMMPPPGFGPQGPGRGPSQPMMPPPGFGPQGPGMEGPRTPPPNFIPQPPEMERMPRGEEPMGFGVPYERDRRMSQRDLRRCVNRFTFIWLINGNSFWFYPTYVDRQFVWGFRWRRNRWEFDRINVNRILFFRCF